MILGTSTRRGAYAFTIMEVLVGLALTALLLGAVVSLVAELGRQRTLITANWRSSRGADAVLDRLERDIAFAIVGDNQRGAGVRGSEDSLTLLSRGVWVGTGPDLASLPAPEYGDLTRIEYRSAPSGSSGGGVAVSESLVAASAPQRSGTIADSVSLHFRYFDRGTWLTEFDSLRRGRLPMAIEVTIWDGATAGEAAAERSGAAPVAMPARVRVIAIPDAGDGTP